MLSHSITYLILILRDYVNKWRVIVYINIFCRICNVKTVHKIFTKFSIIVNLSLRSAYVSTIQPQIICLQCVRTGQIKTLREELNTVRPQLAHESDIMLLESSNDVKNSLQECLPSQRGMQSHVCCLINTTHNIFVLYICSFNFFLFGKTHRLLIYLLCKLHQGTQKKI